MVTSAPKLGSGDGMTAFGTGVGQRVAVVPTVGATGTDTSNVGPDRRNCSSLLIRHGSPQCEMTNARRCLPILSFDCHVSP